MNSGSRILMNFWKNQIRARKMSHLSTTGGIPGEVTIMLLYIGRYIKFTYINNIFQNLPFQVGKTNKMMLYFLLYFVPPFWAPYLVVTYQMLKNQRNLLLCYYCVSILMLYVYFVYLITVKKAIPAIFRAMNHVFLVGSIGNQNVQTSLITISQKARLLCQGCLRFEKLTANVHSKYDWQNFAFSAKRFQQYCEKVTLHRWSSRRGNLCVLHNVYGLLYRTFF